MTESVLVALLHEGVPAWRPVDAEPVDGGGVRLIGEVPEGEEWEFRPGDVISRESAATTDGAHRQVAAQLLSSPFGVIQVRALVTLRPSNDGGLRGPFPSPTRSLLAVFSPGASEASTMVGVDIRALDGRTALEPGARDVPVSLRFWWDGAAQLLDPGREFELWHARIVGAGRLVLDTGLRPRGRA